MPSSDTQFKKGNKAGKGRKKGARNKITKAYLQDVYETYLEHGKEALNQLREKDPGWYLRLVAQLVPKNFDVKHSGDVSVRVVNYSEDDEYQPVNVTQRKE